ncbi:hypothetical protein INR49_017495 [Caranx melampygus]|nr:hypothetical protein INR49_017495 [Caranx melampygus]
MKHNKFKHSKKTGFNFQSSSRDVAQQRALALILLELLGLHVAGGPVLVPTPTTTPCALSGKRQSVSCGPESQERQRPHGRGLIPDQLLPSVSMRGVQQQVCDLRVGQVLQHRLPAPGQRVPEILGEEVLSGKTH